MKLKELQDLDMEILLPLLRQYGIQSYSVEGICISLGAPTSPSLEVASKFEDEQESLPCGHSIWESNEEGECLHGCLHSDKVEDKN